MFNDEADVAFETSPEDLEIPEEAKKFKSTDEDIQAIVEATSAQETTEDSEQAESVPAETVPKEELLKIQEELAETKRQKAASDRKITELAKKGKTDPALEAKVDYLTKTVQLLTKTQAGGYQDVGSLEDAQRKLDDEYSKTSQEIQHMSAYGQHVEDSKNDIFEELRDAGINPDGNDPKVVEIKVAFNEAIKNKNRLDQVVRQARQVAKEARKPVDIEAEVQKRLAQEKQKEHEAKKSSPEYKVVTGGASGAPSTKFKVLDEYNRGIRRSDDPEVKKALGY